MHPTVTPTLPPPRLAFLPAFRPPCLSGMSGLPVPHPGPSIDHAAAHPQPWPGGPRLPSMPPWHQWLPAARPCAPADGTFATPAPFLGDGLLPTPAPRLPGVERARHMVDLYNVGGITRSHLLRALTKAITGCGSNWAAALLTLDQLRAARDPVTREAVPADRIVLNAAIGCCSHFGPWTEAVALFNRMVAAGICPDSRTYTSTITALRHGGNAFDGVRLFMHLLEHGTRAGIDPTVETLTTALCAYADIGETNAAIGLFGHLVSRQAELQLRPQMRPYNAVLEICSRAGRQAEALWVLQMLEEAPAGSGLAPDGLSYLYAIGACEPATGALLIDRAVERGCFNASLGFDERTQQVLLFRNALLAPAFHIPGDCALSAPVAAAVLHRLGRAGAG